MDVRLLDLPLHPMIVHTSVGITVATALLAPVVLLAWTRARLPRGSWWLVVLLQAALFATSLVAVRSGELAEQQARRQLATELIDHHELLAKRFAAFTFFTLLITLTAALSSDERRSKRVAAGATLAILAQLGGGFAVGHAGGAVVWGPDGLIESSADR